GATTGATTALGSGATTAATTAAGGSSLVDGILKYGVPIAGNIASSLIQANASGNASAAQLAYLQEALAYQKQQEASRYGDYTSRIAPYVATGTSANARMASLLGLPTPAPAPVNPNQAPTPPPSVPFPAPTQGIAPGVQPTPAITPGQVAPPTGGAAPMVTMQAPDGTTKQVPADQVAHYTQLGA